MSNKNSAYKSLLKTPVGKIIAAAIILVCIIFSIGELIDDGKLPSWSDAQKSIGQVSVSRDVSGHLQMHVIDIGQGDSILIRCGNKNVLIDAGNNGDGSIVKDYLNSLDITHLDWVIASHPDADHIGGMDEVINSDITVSEFMMPKLPEKLTPTSKTYESLLSALIDKGLSVTAAKSGQSYDLDGVQMLILSPESDNTYKDANNYSVVCKFTYGNNSFILTGDTEGEAEKQMISTWNDELNADILKVGHHGSKNATTAKFLEYVTPQVAVISVGADNSYGHPTNQVLERVKSAGAQCYRTDLSGNVIFSSDGTDVKITTER